MQTPTTRIYIGSSVYSSLSSMMDQTQVGYIINCQEPFYVPLHAMLFSPCADYKKNFLALEQLVLIGGPDDGVITPWQSR